LRDYTLNHERRDWVAMLDCIDAAKLRGIDAGLHINTDKVLANLRRAVRRSLT
jgi:hypothetical protein